MKTKQAGTKKEAKWTGGDWRVGDGEIGAVNDIYAVLAGVVTEVARVRRVPGELEMVVANAHLLAASKDMYAALEDLAYSFKAMNENYDEHPNYIKAQAALAKAEGRE